MDIYKGLIIDGLNVSGVCLVSGLGWSKKKQRKEIQLK